MKIYRRTKGGKGELPVPGAIISIPMYEYVVLNGDNLEIRNLFTHSRSIYHKPIHRVGDRTKNFLNNKSNFYEWETQSVPQQASVSEGGDESGG